MIERRTITDRDVWLAWRRFSINASEYAALHGLHPFKTVAQLAAEKRGVDGLGPDPESVAIRKGVALEDDAADEVAKMHPSWQITKNDIYFIDTDTRIGATPDFIVIDPARDGFGVLQTKVTKPRVYREHWRDGAPIYAVLQTQIEMMLSGASWGVIAPLVDGDHVFGVPALFEIPRVGAAERKIVETVGTFWRSYDAGEEPTIDYDRDQKLIEQLYPKETPEKIIDLSGDNRIRELLAERELQKFAIADATAKLAAVEAEIKHKIKDAEKALLDGWKISFKTVNKKAYSVGPTSYRQLRADRVVDKKEEEEGIKI